MGLVRRSTGGCHYLRIEDPVRRIVRRHGWFVGSHRVIWHYMNAMVGRWGWRRDSLLMLRMILSAWLRLSRCGFSRFVVCMILRHGDVAKDQRQHTRNKVPHDRSPSSGRTVTIFIMPACI